MCERDYSGVFLNLRLYVYNHPQIMNSPTEQSQLSINFDKGSRARDTRRTVPNLSSSMMMSSRLPGTHSPPERQTLIFNSGQKRLAAYPAN